MTSEQLGDGFDGDRSLPCDLGENTEKRAGLERAVLGNRNGMDRRPLVPQPDVTALLTDHAIAEALQRVCDTIPGYAARQSHAASTWISSSFT